MGQGRTHIARFGLAGCPSTSAEIIWAPPNRCQAYKSICRAAGPSSLWKLTPPAESLTANVFRLTLCLGATHFSNRSSVPPSVLGCGAADGLEGRAPLWSAWL